MKETYVDHSFISQETIQNR